MSEQVPVWTEAEIDQEIANLKAAYRAWTTSGSPVSVSVDGVDTTFMSAKQFQSEIYRLKRLKDSAAGIKPRRTVFR